MSLVGPVYQRPGRTIVWGKVLDLDVQLAALLAALAVMVATWLLSLPLRDASIADIAWGLNFIAIAWTVHLVGDGAADRSLLIAVVVTLWGLRLATHIAARHHGEDRRYKAMRAHHGTAFPLRSLFTVFVLQGLIAWVVSVPVQVAATDPSPTDLGILALLGLVVALAGLATEGLADLQLSRFRSAEPAPGAVLATGLWRYSRHPNYFGDSLFWFGAWLIALESGSAWWTVIGPILMTFFLLRVSGVSLTERTITERRPAYAAYIEQTSPFIPRPPRGKP